MIYKKACFSRLNFKYQFKIKFLILSISSNNVLAKNPACRTTWAYYWKKNEISLKVGLWRRLACQNQWKPFDISNATALLRQSVLKVRAILTTSCNFQKICSWRRKHKFILEIHIFRARSLYGVVIAGWGVGWFSKICPPPSAKVLKGNWVRGSQQRFDGSLWCIMAGDTWGGTVCGDDICGEPRFEEWLHGNMIEMLVWGTDNKTRVFLIFRREHGKGFQMSPNLIIEYFWIW